MGGDMIVPGKPEDPMQVIDVRDVADWVILCIENNIVGVYNATGPAKKLSMKAMVEGVREGVGSSVSFVWVENDFLTAQGIREGQFPLYEPPAGETAGFHQCNISRALAKGLRFRDISDTAKVTFEWYQSLPTDLQSRVAPQFARSGNEEAWLEREKR